MAGTPRQAHPLQRTFTQKLSKTTQHIIPGVASVFPHRRTRTSLSNRVRQHRLTKKKENKTQTSRTSMHKLTAFEKYNTESPEELTKNRKKRSSSCECYSFQSEKRNSRRLHFHAPVGEARPSCLAPRCSIMAVQRGIKKTCSEIVQHVVSQASRRDAHSLESTPAPSPRVAHH